LVYIDLLLDKQSHPLALVNSCIQEDAMEFDDLAGFHFTSAIVASSYFVEHNR
jgi:hypothetical protein